jgi:hypothetical protein
MGRAETHKALPLPELYTTRGKRKWEVRILLFDRGPSFRPDLRQARAVARSGGQGWPVFGPPLQRRAASLTAASTTACSGASGPQSANPTKQTIKKRTRKAIKKPAHAYLQDEYVWGMQGKNRIDPFQTAGIFL